MCGIVGIISKENIEKRDLKLMNRMINHRGPDSAGFYVEEKIGLAMRRLKIIDLADGDQPIFNERKDILVFFNGEIYNYIKIRNKLLKKGHTFRTKSDTEVLVHGYEEWGITGLLAKIEGMFSFALFDKKKEKLFIARDKFGEKPLYYFANKDIFCFSSELKSLLSLKVVPRKINPTSLYHYLALHYVTGHKTILSSVYKLEAGHFLELDISSVIFKITKYWWLKEKVSIATYSKALGIVRKLVTKSVKDRMMSDVPMGAFLSGGVDSSIIVGIMSKYSSKKIKTFSIGFNNDEFDESRYSKEVARYFNTEHRHFLFSEKEVLENLPGVINFMDEPIGDQALLPLLLLSKEASKYVTVVLGGEGADEIFGGYSYYKSFSKRKIWHLPLRLIKKESNCFVDEKKYKTSSGFPLISNKEDRMNLIIGGKKNSIKNNFLSLQISENIKKIKNRFKRAQFTDIYSWLPDDLLVKYDRMAMAASIEGRAPFLDSKLVKYAFNLPTSFKWKNGRSKHILREAFSDFLPKSIIKRKKHGFNLPMSEWLRTVLKDELIKSSNMKQDDLIDNVYYKKIIEKHLSGEEERSRLLYSILVYRLWYKSIIKD